MSHKACKSKDGNIGCIDCVAYGEQLAEERIIKLLVENCGCGIWRDHLLGCPHEVAIALIKGENKITLSTADAGQLAEALDAPAKPSEALTKLVKGEDK